MAVDKQTRKGPDEFVTWGTRFAGYATENATIVGAALVLALVLVGSVFGWRQKRADREIEASSKLYAGEKAMVGSVEDLLKGLKLDFDTSAEPTPEDLEKAVAAFDEVAREFPGTKSARRAHLLAGDAYLKLTRYDDAAAAYERAVGGTPLERYYALSGLGHALEGKKAYDEAAAAYARAVDEPAALLKDLATLDRARALAAAGRASDATPLLEKFAENYPDSSLKAEAERRLAELKEATPSAAAAAGALPVTTGGTL